MSKVTTKAPGPGIISVYAAPFKISKTNPPPMWACVVAVLLVPAVLLAAFIMGTIMLAGISPYFYILSAVVFPAFAAVGTWPYRLGCYWYP